MSVRAAEATIREWLASAEEHEQEAASLRAAAARYQADLDARPVSDDVGVDRG